MDKYFTLNYTGNQVKEALDKTQHIDDLLVDIDSLKEKAAANEILDNKLLENISSIKPYVEQKLATTFTKLTYNILDYDFAKAHFEQNGAAFTNGACTTVRSGSLIGRNLDWKQTNAIEYLVELPRIDDRYASISVVSNIQEFTHNISEEDFYKLIPFYAVDGINEYGLFVSNHVVKRDSADEAVGLGNERINQLMLVRYLLDHCKSIDEAMICIKNKLTIYQSTAMLSSDYECQYFIGDKNNSYTVSFKNGEIHIDETNILTNFRIHDTIDLQNLLTPVTAIAARPSIYNNVELFGSGLERYNIAYNSLKDNQLDIISMNELMQKLYYSHTYTLTGEDTWYTEFTGMPLSETESDLATIDTTVTQFEEYLVPAVREAYETDPTDEKFWHTSHSSIYDLDNKTVYITLNEDTTHRYSKELNLIYKFASTTEIPTNIENGLGYNSIQLANSNCSALGENAVAIGSATEAGNSAVSEGILTHAEAEGSHAEGFMTATRKDATAEAQYSHVEGLNNGTNNIAEHGEGKYGWSYFSETNDKSKSSIHYVGIGTSDSEEFRKDAEVIMNNGDKYIYGIGGYLGKNIDNAQTVQTVITGKENSNNKVNLAATNTTTQYPNAKSVWDSLQNVREVAEGKAKTYIIDGKSRDNMWFVDLGINGIVKYIFNEEENAFVSTDHPNISFKDFFVQERKISTESILVPVHSTEEISLKALKDGDVLLLLQTEVPDFWVGTDLNEQGEEIIHLFTLETQKTDLEPYATKEYVNDYAQQKLTEGEGIEIKNNTIQISESMLENINEIGSEAVHASMLANQVEQQLSTKVSKLGADQDKGERVYVTNTAGTSVYGYSVSKDVKADAIVQRSSGGKVFLDSSVSSFTVGNEAVSKDYADTKVSRITGKTDRRVYAQNNGIETTLVAATNNGGSTLIYRDENGIAKITTPIEDDDIANKGYVDSALSNNVAKDTSTIGKYAYGRFAGNETMVGVAERNFNNSLMLRSSTGTSQVSTPINELDVANKGYVDSVVSDKIDTQTVETKLSNYRTAAQQDAIDKNILELAEGKTNSFVIDTSIEGNEIYRTKAETLTTVSFVYNGETVLISSLKKGDVIYTIDTLEEHYPDWFIIDPETGLLGLSNSDQPDLTNVAKIDEENTFAESQTFNKSISVSENLNVTGDLSLGNFDLHTVSANEIQLRKNTSPFLRIQNNLIMPYTTNVLDIGNDTHKIKDLYLSGAINAGKFTIKEAGNGLTQLFQWNGTNKMLIGDIIYTATTLSSLSLNADIGTSVGKYRDGYFSSKVYVPALDNESGDLTVTVGNNKAIKPSWDAHYNLGYSGYRWKDLYLSGDISDGTNSVSVANIENKNNKVASLSSSSTNEQYPSAKVVYDNIQNVREVAEGKCKTFTISYEWEKPVERELSSPDDYTDADDKVFHSWEEIENYVGNIDAFLNPRFNSQENSISTIDNGYGYIVCTGKSSYYKIVRLAESGYGDAKEGDIILVRETDVPDRWISYAEAIKLETSKVDLTNVAKTNEENTFTTTQTFENGANFKGLNRTWNMTTTSNGYHFNINIGDAKYYRFSDSAFYIATASLNIDLGTSTNKWKDLYLSGKVLLPYWNISDSEDYLTVAKDNVNYYRFGTTALFPFSNGTRDLGTTDNKWKNIYASTAYLSSIESAGTLYLGSSAKPIQMGGTTKPSRGDSDLGTTDNKWRDGYFSGVIDAQNTFNVINATEIENNTLTQEQYDLITNGKPTLIKGTLLSLSNIFISAEAETSSAILLQYESALEKGCLEINKTTKILFKTATTVGRIQLRSISQFNGKSIPAYPTQDSTLSYIAGNLTWVNRGQDTIDSLSTTYNGTLETNYGFAKVFTQPLTNLTITDFVISTNDTYRSWKVRFVLDTNGVVSLPSNITFAMGTPTFEVGVEYELLIEKGLADNTYKGHLILG